MDEPQLLAIMAAIIYAGGEAVNDVPRHSAQSAVKKADAILDAVIKLQNDKYSRKVER